MGLKLIEFALNITLRQAEFVYTLQLVFKLQAVC
jgi:hypothetical protein